MQIPVKTTPVPAAIYVGDTQIGTTPGRAPENRDAWLYAPGYVPVRIPQRQLATNVFGVSADLVPVQTTHVSISAEERRDAWTLTKNAIAAAHAGDCAAVRALDQQVLAKDGEVHEKLFVQELTIAQCLAAAQSEPTP